MNSQSIFNEVKVCFQDVLSENAAIELSLQILLWVKKTDVLPEKLRVDYARPKLDSRFVVEQLTEAMAHLSEAKRVGDSDVLFFPAPIRYQSVPTDRVQKSIAIAQSALQASQLHSFRLSLSEYQSAAIPTTADLLPSELAQLATGLADISPGTDVGCFYDYAGSFAQLATAAGGNAHLETPHQSNIPWLIRELAGVNFSIGFVNPLARNALSTSQKQRKFDKAIAPLPVGKVRDKKTIDGKWLSLLSRETSSKSLLAAVYALSQTREKLVLIVPSSLLSARGSEQKQRQTWLKNKQVQTVIELASGLLPRSNAQISILVLTAKGTADHVRFVDATTKRFVTRDKRQQARLTNVDQLLAIARSPLSEDPQISNVPVQQVLEQDSQLTVDRFVLSPLLKKAYSQLEQVSPGYQKVTLGSCVSFIRQSAPLTKTEGSATADAKEVRLSDFPEFGYLTIPNATLQINGQLVDSAMMRECCLHPYDIIMSIRGTTGKVAIASPHIPSPGLAGWLVNKSCLILRANQSIIDPIYLFMYLRSGIGQALLGQIVSGSTTPLIQLQSLKNLPVALPPLGSPQSLKATKIFERQVQLQEEIDFLSQEQSRLSKHYWGLDEPM
ncbi:N-6 DNA methylase [cf. Phormidesmis sp. LEGE 11477]|uniref:N-6 DNA methylase n=1 Tax=cf. Phormidesmis sp. LEGE 11477 TaxID=1828680 RepID=UPI0018824664|nr:N-6 DNA methylase [cf. Phormidesmis sp. LEGE 11477]MBE9061806.1 N-6 DNA methylase [cf. Phormidesmis sp. LEGE 11477]